MRAYDVIVAASGKPDRALDALTRFAEVREDLDRREAALIEAARHAGAGWAAIADALGLATRQAGEQRLQRLRRRVGQRTVDSDPVIRLVTAVASAAAALAADADWDTRHPRAGLVRQCLGIAAALPDAAAPGGLFSLVNDVLADIAAMSGVDLPAPQRTALDALTATAGLARPTS